MGTEMKNLLIYSCIVLSGLNSTNIFAQEKAISVRQVQQAIEDLPANMPKPPKRIALLVSAGEFEDDDIPKLPQCRKDIEALYKVLTDPSKGLFERKNVAVLFGKQATKNNIIRKLDDLAGQIESENDLVIVYFTGHGVVDPKNRSYWVTYDTDVGQLRASALPENEISDLLSDIKTTRLVTLIDSCFASATALLPEKSKALINVNSLYPEFSGKGRVAITASDGNEQSLVVDDDKHPGNGHSVFTYHLVNGLSGKADSNEDGVITVDEIWSHVKDKTSTTARNLGGKQTPQLKGKMGSRFLLTVNADVLTGNFADRKRRLEVLKEFARNKEITIEQYQEAKVLLTRPASALTDRFNKRREIYISVAEKELPVEKLQLELELETGTGKFDIAEMEKEKGDSEFPGTEGRTKTTEFRDSPGKFGITPEGWEKKALAVNEFTIEKKNLNLSGDFMVKFTVESSQHEAKFQVRLLGNNIDDISLAGHHWNQYEWSYSLNGKVVDNRIPFQRDTNTHYLVRRGELMEIRAQQTTDPSVHKDPIIGTVVLAKDATFKGIEVSTFSHDVEITSISTHDLGSKKTPEEFTKFNARFKSIENLPKGWRKKTTSMKPMQIENDELSLFGDFQIELGVGIAKARRSV